MLTSNCSRFICGGIVIIIGITPIAVIAAAILMDMGTVTHMHRQFTYPSALVAGTISVGITAGIISADIIAVTTKTVPKAPKRRA